MAKYQVVNRQTRGVVNVIPLAPDERVGDSAETRDAKRRAHACNIRDQWLATALKGRDLVVEQIKDPFGQ